MHGAGVPMQREHGAYGNEKRQRERVIQVRRVPAAVEQHPRGDGGEDGAEATDADRATLGNLLLAAAEIAKKLGLKGGYRVVINNGPDAGESVPHLHVHLLGDRALSWPPG